MRQTIIWLGAVGRQGGFVCMRFALLEKKLKNNEATEEKEIVEKIRVVS